MFDWVRRSIVVGVIVGTGCGPEPLPTIECVEYGDVLSGFEVSCAFDQDLDDVNASLRLNGAAPDSAYLGGWRPGFLPIFQYHSTAYVEFPYLYDEGGRRAVEVTTDSWQATFEWTSSGLDYDQDGVVVELEVVTCEFTSCAVEAVPSS